MSERPSISVITAVYNGAAFIEETIRSILSQTFTDFEYILIDDASTDDSVDRIKAFRDPRLRLFRNSSNRRLVETRNVGLEAARGRYIALIDHDDLAHPRRLEVQLKALAANPRLVLVGSWCKYIDGHGRPLGAYRPRPDSPALCKASLLFTNRFANSSLFFRREGVPAMRYRPEFPLAEDFDFIARFSEIGEIWVVPEALISYRIHSNNYGRQMGWETMALSAEVKRRLIEHVGLSPSKEEIELHHNLQYYKLPLSREVLVATAEWLAALLAANRRSGIHPPGVLEQLVSEQLALMSEHAAKQGPATWRDCLAPPYRRSLASRPLATARILVKLALRAFRERTGMQPAAAKRE
ncbi:MAG: epsE 3 [Rhodocyclaceae bacterium]|nr:epsE 3 [Rhodocyclaceae bacterium]